MTTTTLASTDVLVARVSALAGDFLQRLPASDEHAFPSDELAALAEVGLLAAPLPREAGGLDLDGRAATLPTLLRVLCEVGRGNLALGRVYEGHVNALALIASFATPAQQACWATDARAGEFFGVWNTEAGDGVRFEPLGAGRWRLTGAKTFASGAGHVTRPVVSGRLPDGGWQLAVIPWERVAVGVDPSWWQPLGMAASVSYRVDFSGVELTADDLLGGSNDYHRQPWFSAGAVRFAAVQLGGAQALYDSAREALRALGRTDDPYQRQRFGEGAILLASGVEWLRSAGRWIDLGQAAAERDPAPALARAAMTRTAIETICLDVIRLVERSVGVRGMLRPSPIERLLRDLTMYLRQPAPDAALALAGQYALDSPLSFAELWDADVDAHEG